MVVDLCPGVCWSLPYGFTAWNGRLHFTASAPRGREVWKTQGSPRGTGAVVAGRCMYFTEGLERPT
jgi:hypothetical protein